MKQGTISAMLALIISAALVEVDPSNSHLEEIGLFGQNAKELFEYATKADEIHEV